MAKNKKSQHPDLIEEIDSIADRGADWVRAHLGLSIMVVVAILVAAGSYGGMRAHNTRKAESASDALDQVTTDFLTAMGADPGSLVVPELANPAAATQIRSDYAARYAAVAAEHAGTSAAALARLEEGNLTAEAGDFDRAASIWQAALAEWEGQPNLRAIFQHRIGRANESAERWLEAGEAHEAASEVDSYPLRYWAMASAARCYAQAGEQQRARDLALRVSQLAPDLEFPEYLMSLLEELRLSQTP